MDEKVMPVRLTDETTGTVYELDFCRESILFAERQKFQLEEALAYPVSGMRDLFYLAFRMHHKSVARANTDKFIERWGGAIPDKLAERLVQLYMQARNSNAITLDEDAEKNAGLTLEL